MSLLRLIDHTDFHVQSYGYNASYEPYGTTRSRRRSISTSRYAQRDSLDDVFYDNDDAMIDTRTNYLDAHPRRNRSRSRYSTSGRPRSRSFRASSPVSFSRRSPSPMGYGAMGSGVGMTSAAVTYPSAYDPVLGPGIPGTYYPNAGSSPVYGSSSTGYPYQQVAPTTGYAVAGGSPYMSPVYAGSSVGLPPPPTGQYLTAQDTTRGYGHHRTRSAGAYGATRPSFGY